MSVTNSDKYIAEQIKKQFPDSVFVGIFSNVCFVFGVFKPGSPNTKQGEYGYVACLRRCRSKKTGKEHLRYDSSWMLDKNECLIMQRGFNRIVRSISQKLA